MKALKIIAVTVVVAALSIAGVVTVFGKPGNADKAVGPHAWFGNVVNPEEIAEILTGHMQEKLELTDEQKTEVLAVVKAHIAERADAMQQGRQQMRENMQQAMADHESHFQELEAELSEILTEEQMQTLRDTMQNEWGHVMERRTQMAEGDFQVPGHGLELLQELDLTLDQKKELFGIAMKYRDMHKDTREEMLELRKQAATTMLDLLNTEEFDEVRVRETFQDSAAKLEDVVVTGAKMLSEMKAVLTPEQQELLQQKGAEFLEKMENGDAWGGHHMGFRDRMSRRRPFLSFRFGRPGK